MTPYHSEFPINSITPVEPPDPDLPRRKQFHQSIVGCTNFLAICSCPYIVPALTFLASYSNSPHPQHYKAVVHALKYLTIMNEYSVSFHPKSSSMIQVFDHFSHNQNKGSYIETTVPSPSECYQLTPFLNTNWGGQFITAV